MTVYLVGAGPGDPGLLTVRGAQVLRRAEVVVYDRLSVGSLLDLAPDTAERINVGKRPGHATMPQADINALLVQRGEWGQEVVRLKGGDPFVFARGGEEAQALLDADVVFEVVPGISSAIAVPTYAGIPLTMRHSSELFTVITGHEDPDKGGELDWKTVAKLGGTIVVLMGIGRLPKIVDRLVAGGLAPETPIAVVRWGTRPDQNTVRATLGTILDHADELAAPSTIVIGKVAALDLDWFESRPLFGKRIVVTRASDQASSMAAMLREQGAASIELPVIDIVDPPDGGVALRKAVERVQSYDWVVFTSANAARRVLDLLQDARSLGGVKIATIGPGTADVLQDANLVADLLPERYVAEALVEVFPDADPAAGAATGTVLLPRALVARDVLPDGLRAKGWTVDEVTAYETKPVTLSHERKEEARTADVVTFTSSSTVQHFVDAVGADRVPPVVACIGPITADTARDLGLDVTIEATVHTVAGLVDALVAYYRGVG